MQSLQINVLELLHNSIKTETEEAEQKELNSWIQVDVYKDVLNEGQKTVSTCGVVSPKVVDGVMSTTFLLSPLGIQCFSVI